MSWKIRTFGDPVLQAKAHTILKITPEIQKLGSEMVRIMIESDAVGLAATQIGALHRMFVMRDERVGKDGEYEFLEPEIILNPELTSPSVETESMKEGCLSLPGISIKIKRPKSIHLRYQTLDGVWIETKLSDLKARIAMHETDHLDGILILDRASPADKAQAMKKLKTNFF